MCTCMYMCVCIINAHPTATLKCKLYQFKCKSVNRCISNIQLCDGENDCSDGSDERNCSKSLLCIVRAVWSYHNYDYCASSN